MAIENKGVIYYKLDPHYHYEGDYTKNCGLNGGEIDGNFHFLRGYDISSFDVSEDKNILTITRFNGEEIKVNIEKEFPDYEYDFSYDSENGILKVVSPSGKVLDIEGFLTNLSSKVYVDGSIIGDGTKRNPLSVSRFIRTGMYKPAKALVDTLPTSNIGRNDIYVTKEQASKFGLLYPIEGVKEISNRLREINSEWRVPTKEDWDNLLNLVEDCDEYKNHNEIVTNTFLGENAGSALKTVEYWDRFYRRIESGESVMDEDRFSLDANGNYVHDAEGKYVGEFNSTDKYGFSIYPVGFGGRQGVENIEGFGKWAAYWTLTEDDAYDDMYVKVFSYKEKGVEQTTWGTGCHLSLRLVKDFTGTNFSPAENIDGNAIVAQLFPSDDETKTLIWTAENVDFSNPQYGGVMSSEWDSVLKTVYRYYVNEWDGTKWIKNVMMDGDTIVIHDVDGVRMHEWRVDGGELIDTLKEVNDKIDELTEYFNDKNVDVKDEISNLDRIVAENKVTSEDSSIVVIGGKTDGNTTEATKIKVNLPSSGMIKLDEHGLYLDGNFNFGDDWKIN